MILFSVATYQRNRVWNDEISLWSDVVQKSPNKARGYNNLGVAYVNQNRLDQAVQTFKTALTLFTLKSDLAQTNNNLGNAYKHAGRTREAMHEFERALQIKPDYQSARQALESVSQ